MVEALEPLAGTAASLLAGASLGRQGRAAELNAWPDLAQLVALIYRAAADDSTVRAALEAVTAAPRDPDYVAALGHALHDCADNHTELRAQLAGLLDQAQHDPTAGPLVTEISGHAKVGKVVTIGRAGDIHVYIPPKPPPTVLDQLPTTRPGPLVSNLPPHNPNFTGREELLAGLHNHLHKGESAAVVQVQAQAVHGLGGVGKSQLALEYAHRHAHEYDLIWWVTAEQRVAIPDQLAIFARRLGITEHAERAETIQALWDALRRRDRWLLVFDNAEQPQDLRFWWPPASGKVLITSRYPTWTGLAATITVDVLPRAEAVAFLRHRLGWDDPALDKLAATLGDLPLALEQAGAYLHETSTSLADYLRLLGERAQELFALGTPSNTEQTIATTWTVALNRLRESAPGAQDVLTLCAFLAPDDIPRSLFTDYPDQLPIAIRDQLDLQQAMSALHRFALATVTKEAIGVHRLVQAVVRHRLNPASQQEWASVVVKLVLAGFPEGARDVAVWPISARLLPHALAVTDHTSSIDVESNTTAVLLSRASHYLYTLGEYDQATGLSKRALDIREARSGPKHMDTAVSLTNLAVDLHAQGDFHGARLLLERALRISKARRGRNDLSTASILGNLATVLHEMGDLTAARNHQERALRIRQARLGPDHLEVALGLNNLGSILYDQRDFEGARAHHERALRIRETRLGPDHPDTAQSLDNLGTVVQKLGNLADARTLRERALAIREARLDPDHPDIAHSLNNLGGVMYHLGDLAAARTLHERALRIRETRLGPDHPDTLRSQRWLAAVQRELKK
jgi:tetratricopeptide (TPR) repeat protein